MSIEGMWCFVSDDIEASGLENGGVIILDTQRIYGGDSAMAYVGTYETAGGTVRGEVETFRYNPAIEGTDVFGEPMGPPRQTLFEVSLNEGGLLVGHLERQGVQLPIVLQKLRALP